MNRAKKIRLILLMTLFNIFPLRSLDMTQDRPLIGLSPTPDEVYLPPNNPSYLRNVCGSCSRYSKIDGQPINRARCFNRWRNRYDCFPCRKKWQKVEEPTCASNCC